MTKRNRFVCKAIEEERPDGFVVQLRRLRPKRIHDEQNDISRSFGHATIWAAIGLFDLNIANTSAAAPMVPLTSAAP
jgi:hypothetical protein